MKISELVPDQQNANKGTERGSGMLEHSLRKHGAGRSILIDKHGRIIAGNKTAEHAGAIGLEDVIVVQTDGTKLVAVQRMDLDLSTDKSAKELAIADNRTSELSLSWDVDNLKALDVDLSQYWSPSELETLFCVGGETAMPIPEIAQESWSIMIDGLTEKQQTDLLERLTSEGFACRALIS